MSGPWVASRASLGALTASLVAQGALVISGPATARLLGLTGRGELALLAVVVTLGTQLGGAGLPTAVAYTIARNRTSARAVLRVVGLTWTFLCVAAGGISAGMVIVIAIAEGRSWSSTSVEALLVALFVLANMTLHMIIACLQGEHRFRLMNHLVPLASIMSAAVLFVLLVTVHRAGVIAVLGTLVAVKVLVCLVGAAAYLPHANDHQSNDAVPTTLGSLLGFGLRSLAGASDPVESLSIDQAVVGLLLSRQQLGLYVVGAAFDNLPSMLMSGLGTVALPRIASEKDLAERSRAMKRTLLFATLVVAAASIFAELVVGIVLPIAFGNSFAGAIPVARVLIVAGFFFAIRRVLVVFLQAAGYPGRTAVGEAFAVGALVAFGLTLIPPFGLVGAGGALLAAAIVADAYLVWVLRAHFVSPVKS